MSMANEGGEKVKIPDLLPVLPLRDMVVYPFIIAPLSVARELSIKAVDRALAGNRMILLVAQRDKDREEPEPEDLFEVGTVAVIMRMLKLPDGRLRVLVQGVSRARVRRYEKARPHFQARIEPLTDPPHDPSSLEQEALMRSAKRLLERASSLGKNMPSEVMVIAGNLEDPGRLADLTASNLELRIEESQSVLELLDPAARLKRVHDFLKRELDLLSMQREIDSLARDEMDRSQREYYLRHQMKAIQTELGEGNELQEEVERYRQKAKELELPDEAREELDRQLKRLERMHPDSSESTIVRNYLDWVTGLPWGRRTRDNLDLKKAAKILDADHHGLEAVKDRILEYLAVRKLNRQSHGPILCFVGPPGVGKTSLGRSIARALGRKFARLSLGGVKDEAEIRGHRRTYVGAMPGRVIQGVHAAGSCNPVFILDEVDKIGADYRGDPSAALLEVLDPEQNVAFRDHYLGVPFDLSDVMFITTANLLEPIQPAFRDRMEVIRLSGYTEDEKVSIAMQYLLPKQMKNNGLKEGEISVTEPAVRDMVRYYTREAGVRSLEREISKVCRKAVKQLLTEKQEKEGKAKRITVSPRNLDKFLGVRKYTFGMAEKKNQIGQVTGLAWTEVGGELLTIETVTMPGKGKTITTGKLGEVMQESIQAALSVVRNRSRKLGVPEDFYQKNDMHIHLPEGATPKDGPSAGIGIATSMVSVLTGIPVRADVAMTGEITLRGEVLAIGGLKEKLLAAHRGGIKTVMIPEENVKDLVEIPDNVKNRLEIVPVKWIDKVLEIALERQPVPLSDAVAAAPAALPPAEEKPGSPAAVKH